MKILPIEMQKESVRAILAEVRLPGSGKTQTRRLAWTRSGKASPWQKLEVGDLLWVREDWHVSARHDHWPPRDIAPRTLTVFFTAGGSIANQESHTDWRPDDWPKDGLPDWAGKSRSKRFLPKWASRLTLTVTDVRVQRVQDISEEDAIAEGAEIDHGLIDGTEDQSQPPMVRVKGRSWHHCTVRAWYHGLWDHLHGPGSWEANPEVVAITFQPVLGNVEAVLKEAA